MDFPRANIVRLGPRVPIAEPDTLGRMEAIMNIVVPNRVVEARAAATSTSSSSTATGSCGANACQLPVSSSTFTMPIILGVAIPVIGAAILFIILQRRHVKKQREEDRNDRHASMDFGLGEVPQPGRGKKPPSGVDYSEKPGMSRRQLSMDMNMNSPYLLPPELHNSRESIHSLSRSIIHQNEDPYSPVNAYYADGASIRSQSKQGSSIYTGQTGSSGAPSRMQDLGTADLLGNASSMSRSTPPSTAFVPPPRSQSKASPVEHLPENPLPPPPYPVEPPKAYLPEPATSPGILRKGLPTNPRPGQLGPALPAMQDSRESYNGDVDAIRHSNNYLGSFISPREPSPPPPPPAKALERELPSPGINRKSPPVLNSLPSNPRPVRKESMNAQPQSFMDDESEYGDAFKVTPPSPGRENMRGQRYSMDVPPEEFAQAGLGAPGFDPKRLSMGFRPLPPNAVTETDDPEIRANRIRSFYKEYFDESKPAPQGQYYEDYDENYLGDAAYFDSDTNQFVMPYAEPVTRRAMTPPPNGARFQGFQGPPRPRQGSMGAMSTMSGGRSRGPQMYPPGPYPQGPRAYSSASGRMDQRGPRRPIPPPAPLNTLPTPSKLRDDSFALMGSIEFAPPQTYRDRAAGRSESPFGERRPYSPAVPSFAPVVSAFEELAPIPSPHMLRKSGTFTSLDFAAPRKFRDPDSMSDAGSIRSNQSGVSQRQLGAIRNGAYRVSRIQKDVVFTKDDMAATLKPQWGMRAN